VSGLLYLDYIALNFFEMTKFYRIFYFLTLNYLELKSHEYQKILLLVLTETCHCDSPRDVHPFVGHVVQVA
jgi:hypothetical protein